MSEKARYTPAEKYQKSIERASRRRARLPLALSAVALASSSLSFVVQSDIQANQQKSIESEPQLDVIENIYPDSNSAIFYLAGFDTRDGSVFGDRLGTAIHYLAKGEDVSVNYGNAPLEPAAIAEKIIAYAEENDLETISLAGNSLGGIVSTAVMEHIITSSSVEVEAIILNATPDGSDGLRAETQSELKTMVDVLDSIENSKYSSFARYAMTMILERGRFTNRDSPLETIDHFIKTSNSVIEQVQEERRPGMWLVVDQALALTNTNMEDMLRTVGDQRGEKRMPVIVVLRPENPEDDTVVDVEKSSKNICAYAAKAALYCTIIHVADAKHTSYQFNTELYTEAIAERAEGIKGLIEKEDVFYESSKRDY